VGKLQHLWLLAGTGSERFGFDDNDMRSDRIRLGYARLS